MIEIIHQAFEKNFGGKGIYRLFSPARVNLIGEHTDYNEGFVLPASIQLGTWFILRPNQLNKYRIYSYNYNDTVEFPLSRLRKSKKHWANYLIGVIAQFVKNGKMVRGFDCAFGGNIPLGAGLSSSASIETGFAAAINKMESLYYSRFDLIKFSQKAEHEFAGVQCGIMDQFAVMTGQKNQVIKLDCRTLDFTYYPFPENEYMLVLVNSGIKHKLGSSAYNIRRKECEMGVHILKYHYPNLRTLRDATPEMIEMHKNEMPDNIYKRCRYVTEENQRVEKACQALLLNDLHTFGSQMNLSHNGLRDLYAVSCHELDYLVNLARQVNGVIGSRMMGAGFGGCTINLMRKEAFGRFKENILRHYKTPLGKVPEVIIIQLTEGTHLL